VQKPERVLITTPSLVMSVFPIMMAKAKGFYRDDGLAADLIVMRTDLTIRAVISGEAEFSTPFPTALRAILSGYPMRVVMGLMAASDFGQTDN
jgi:ABC-type nitrate/sulfonate/bicarbonate transport system substrate-binding protein